MSDNFIGLRTLVLNPDYSPVAIVPSLSTIPAEEAIVRVIKENADCILTFKRKILTPSHDDWFWPSVIVNKEFYKRYTDVRLRHISLFYRDHGMCQYCEKKLTEHEITCDHVVPRTAGGKHEWTNVVASCKRCNGEKDDNMPVGKWKPKIKPYTPTFYDILDKRRKFPILVDDAEWEQFIGGKTGNWEGGIVVRKEATRLKQEMGLTV